MATPVQHGTLLPNGRLNLEVGPEKKIINVKVHNWFVGSILSLFGKAIKLHVKVGPQGNDKSFFVNKRSLAIRALESAPPDACKMGNISKAVCNKAINVLFPDRTNKKQPFSSCKFSSIDIMRLATIVQETQFAANELAVKQGNSEAQYATGLAYQYGKGVPKDLEKAREYYEKAAKQGHDQAKNNLGRLLENGWEGVEPNQTRAVELYKDAADKGNMDAQFNYGYVLTCGIGVEKNLAEAAKYYEKAAKQGHGQAKNNLGRLLENGREGVEPNQARAVELYKDAADTGNMGAQFNYGYVLSCGIVVQKNLAEAAKYYEKAAKQGHDQAKNNLGRLLENGWEGVEPNLPRAVELFKDAADTGNMGAQFNYGYVLSCGIVVQKNLAEAAKYYEKAAKQGHGQAKNNLGRLLEKGWVGVEPNLPRAVELYKDAADTGNMDAQFNYGYVLACGIVVQKNLAEAANYYEKAEKQGHDQAKKTI